VDNLWISFPGPAAGAGHLRQTPKLPYVKNRRSLGFDLVLVPRRAILFPGASFGIKGRKTGKIFGPGLDFRILKAYITRMQELLQLERRKD